MVDLKTCPFCGASASICGGFSPSKIRLVICSDCGASTFDQEQSDEEAAAEWNRRTPSPAVRALVEAVDVLNRNKIQWLTCPSDWDAVREALAAVEREIGGE